MEGSTPSQGPHTKGIATGRFGRQSLERTRREFEVRRENFGRISPEEFRSPNQSLGHKMQIPALLDFNAGICCYFYAIFEGTDTFLRHQKEPAHRRWPNSGCGIFAPLPKFDPESYPGLKPVLQKIPA
jgi:hypothetical protein